MKIELNNNKVLYKNGSSTEEIHPFWLRERANGKNFLDEGTQQRLFDPTSLNVEVEIKKRHMVRYKDRHRDRDKNIDRSIG